MPQTLPWTPWHQVVRLRDDVRSGELTLADFAADLHDVVAQKGARPIYEDPGRFFALTYPTLPLRALAKDVALRLAGSNTKAVRQLELTYGGGKTHTLVALHHLVHSPESLPALPAVDQFRAHIEIPLPTARVAALCFDKLDVEKGMETRGPAGELRWLKHPWSVLAFQIAGEEGLRSLHADGANEERATPPAEPLLTNLLSLPQAHGLGTLVLIDEVLMYAREKAASAEGWNVRLVNFFQYLCQAAIKVDRCALVASLLASDPEMSDPLGKRLTQQISNIFNRQRELAIEPVQKEDVAEVMRRRFFETESIAKPESFRQHVTVAVNNIAKVDETVRKDRAGAEQRFLNSFPIHPDLTEIFYTKWTQIEGFQRTRGILRTFAIALRDAQTWDQSPLVGPNVFLPKPGKPALPEAVRELAGTASRHVTDGAGNDWNAVLEGELTKARVVQNEEHSVLRFREVEQAVCAVFLGSQPIGQKMHTQELMALIGATRPDRIELEKGLRRWTGISWFLDEVEFATAVDADSGPDALPKAWRLGNQPNLKQMHDHACKFRVTESSVEKGLRAEIPKTKSLTREAKEAGAQVHTLPRGAQDIQDDLHFHFAILGPAAVSDSGKPSKAAKKFIEETTGPDRPRIHRNSVVLVAPSRDGLAAARVRIREFLGWKEVRAQLEGQTLDRIREDMLASWTEQARKRVPDAIRQAWKIVVTVDKDNKIQAFEMRIGADPLFATVKADLRVRIQETEINAEALLPGGPYDLWRKDEPSRRVKNLVGAFAENPKLPKMLRPENITRTIKTGVSDGIFVASLARPDRSVRTWWRTPVDEATLQTSALEIFLAEKAVLSELDPTVLSPGVLPELWVDEQTTLAKLIEYFEAGQTIPVQRDGYEEIIAIPTCPHDAIEEAVSEAVSEGIVWLVNGSASFQGEQLPTGVLTHTAMLRSPMQPLRFDELMRDAVPMAWNAGQATAAALRSELSKKKLGLGLQIPWPILQQAIDGALGAGWLLRAPGSGEWPCDAAGATSVKFKEPDGGGGDPDDWPSTGSVELQPDELQNLSDALPSVITTVAGSPLRFHVCVTLEDSEKSAISSVNDLLAPINHNLRLK